MAPGRMSGDTTAVDKRGASEEPLRARRPGLTKNDFERLPKKWDRARTRPALPQQPPLGNPCGARTRARARSSLESSHAGVFSFTGGRTVLRRDAARRSHGWREHHTRAQRVTLARNTRWSPVLRRQSAGSPRSQDTGAGQGLGVGRGSKRLKWEGMMVWDGA